LYLKALVLPYFLQKKHLFMSDKINLKRRDFMKHSSLAAGALMTSPLIGSGYGFHNSTNDEIKIALVGCGGRGSGAATQALSAAPNV